jgi:hypothetical protein
VVRQRFALVADVVFLLLAGAAAFIGRVGGVRWQIGGLRLTAGSGTRAAAIAIIVLVARHAVVPHPSFAARLLTTLRHVKRLVRSPRLAAAADVVIVSLGALAFTVDLAGGVEWQVGALEVSLPDGTRLALAAVAVWLLRRVAFTGTSPFQLWLARWRERALPVAFEWPSGREWLLASVVVGGATALLLRQQVLAFTSVPDLGDPLFSMWRLAWVAHQLPRDPLHLFDANIFHPAVRTLAYSDAALLPALIAAPALWLGAPLAVVYTSLILFSFVAAGLAMFALARAISGHVGGALIGGLVFAFDPFRFSHYSHLELEFTFWMPLAALCVLRALTTGDQGAGVLAGVLVALQGLSSLYYGAYFAVSLAVLVMCWIAVLGLPTRRALVPLATTVLLGTAAAALVTTPYWTSRSAVGERTVDETRAFSARGRDYLTASRHSAVYGTRLYDREGGERELFPGTVPILLGAMALLPPLEPAVVPAAMTLAASVDASLGLRGTIYRWLHELPPFRAFRVPARFRAIAGLYFALLAGSGAAAIARRISSVWPRRATLWAIGIAVLIDVHPTLELQPLWNHAPGIYNGVADRRAVLADLPLPWGQDAFWHDPVYVYFSTFHWHPIINGSSGFTPAWYEPLGALARDFPSDPTLDAFRTLGTEYFVLHEGYYGTPKFNRVVADAGRQPRLELVATSTWEEGECRLYRLRR